MESEAKSAVLIIITIIILTITSGNITLPGNSTAFLKDLDASSALLDEIAKNNSDSQTVTLMTDILKKKVTDIGILVSGNGTDIMLFSDEIPPGDFVKGVTCAAVFVLSGNIVSSLANGYMCVEVLA